VIKRFARKGVEFSATDIWRAMKGKPDPSQRRRIGCLFREAKDAGVIEHADIRRTKSPTRKGGLEHVWRGVRR